MTDRWPTALTQASSFPPPPKKVPPLPPKVKSELLAAFHHNDNNNNELAIPCFTIARNCSATFFNVHLAKLSAPKIWYSVSLLLLFLFPFLWRLCFEVVKKLAPQASCLKPVSNNGNPERSNKQTANGKSKTHS